MFGALGGRARRRLDDGDHAALILDREEAAGQAPEQQQRDGDERGEDREEAQRPDEDAADDALIASGRPREPAVEPAEEAVDDARTGLRCDAVVARRAPA